MTSLYRKASARLPAVRDQHKELARGLIPLFDTEEYVVRQKYTYSPPPSHLTSFLNGSLELSPTSPESLWRDATPLPASKPLL